ncbi:FAD/NAD(P)-binding domain-containing protein [Phialemonium atrogriseum]|uniref:FAD/NAD(P)-binding domain-containing protein n=1 Tax=Phialemonium atrogriseum TaxID=1093897 RepID=A0AAJ0BU35_9PEZI|nr:FAD/NAD(P)-binding domain-containing protein [Phialemonium atrogriseum]KAK1764510.1 FAD/NAD(P)-binding domain-containing protein [Phialemonium atrogriseum]
MASKPETRAHVLIIGAGPVGMMCASKLSHAGIKTTVVESDKFIPPIPKALTYTAPVLADLKKLGVLEEVQKISFADEHAIWQWRTLGGELLADMHWSLLEDHADPRLVKPYTLQCGQHLLAEVLTEYCGRFPSTEVLFDHALVGLTQDASQVTAQVSRSGGEPFEIKADWVIGADGGKSATRKFIDQSLEGFTWNESFVAMNVHFPFPKYGWGAANFLIGGKEWAVAGRSGPLTDPWRVAFGVEVGLTDEQVMKDIAPDRLKRILPGPDPYEIVQCSQYRVHQRQVQQYKVGRVVLAGDAAHLNNPIGGFGLTTGMTDAGCISDALILVIRGEAPEEFLQKACDVRREIFATVSNPGSQKFKAMVQQDPDNICAEDREFFEKLKNDAEFHRSALTGVMRLYTPVEDLMGK